MIVYPMLARAIGLDAQQAGVFLGATIHDVAQVVGAGYSMSHETGDVATLVKLMRVAMLLPVIVFAAVMCTRASGREPAARARRCCPGSRSPSRAGGGQQHRLAADALRRWAAMSRAGAWWPRSPASA